MKFINLMTLILFCICVACCIACLIAYIWVTKDPHHYIGKTLGTAAIVGAVSFLIGLATEPKVQT